MILKYSSGMPRIWELLFFFCVVGGAVLHESFRGNHPDAGDLLAHQLDVREPELNPASRRHAVIGQAGFARPEDDEVQHVGTEIVIDAVLHAAARAEQQHQHEDAPEHAERGEHGAQLVLPQREQDFLQAVQHG